MSIFKLYECDVSLSINGTTYQFLHVQSVTYEDPERTRLIRGNNAGNNIGISYREGLDEAKVITLTVKGMSASLHSLLKQCFKDQTRMDVEVISRKDGSSKIAKNAVLAQSPKQLTIDDSAESMDTALIFESFDVDEVHKGVNEGEE